MTNLLVKQITEKPHFYVGTFSFTYGRERITQVIRFGKHADSICSWIPAA